MLLSSLFYLLLLLPPQWFPGAPPPPPSDDNAVGIQKNGRTDKNGNQRYMVKLVYKKPITHGNQRSLPVFTICVGTTMSYEEALRMRRERWIPEWEAARAFMQGRPVIVGLAADAAVYSRWDDDLQQYRDAGTAESLQEAMFRELLLKIPGAHISTIPNGDVDRVIQVGETTIPIQFKSSSIYSEEERRVSQVLSLQHRYSTGEQKHSPTEKFSIHFAPHNVCLNGHSATKYENMVVVVTLFYARARELPNGVRVRNVPILTPSQNGYKWLHETFIYIYPTNGVAPKKQIQIRSWHTAEQRKAMRERMKIDQEAHKFLHFENIDNISDPDQVMAELLQLID